MAATAACVFPSRRDPPKQYSIRHGKMFTLDGTCSTHVLVLFFPSVESFVSLRPIVGPTVVPT